MSAFPNNKAPDWADADIQEWKYLGLTQSNLEDVLKMFPCSSLDELAEFPHGSLESLPLPDGAKDTLLAALRLIRQFPRKSENVATETKN